MKFAIDESITLFDIRNKLLESGVKYMDYKKLKFTLNEGGYGACILIEYQEEDSEEDGWY